MLKVLSVFGTRPEAIKMAPVVRELARYPELVESRVCVTAQHRELLDQVLRTFRIRPDYDLGIMAPDQGLSEVAARVLGGLDGVLAEFGPDWVVVQGDTTTTLAGALAGFHRGARVAHVEAGLRTPDRRLPFPEEMNRRLVATLADFHFAPTEAARRHLLAEGVDDGAIAVTGNTSIDALLCVAGRGAPADPLAADQRRLVLVTAHRRESFGAPLRAVCDAIRRLARARADIRFVYPVHPNPDVVGPVHRALGDLANVSLTEPLEYVALVHLLQRSYLVLTDSGGLQEEAPSLGKPVLVLRDVTERPEAVEAGTARLVGTEPDVICAWVERLLDDPVTYAAMARAVNPYGDGQAALRIVRRLLRASGIEVPGPAHPAEAVEQAGPERPKSGRPVPLAG